MPPPRPFRSALALVAVVVAGTLVGACGGPHQATVVRPGDVVDGSATAYVGEHAVVFMVPSGRVTVTVGDPVDDVGGIDTGDGAPITAAPGSALVGVTWSLDRGAYPNAVNFQVAAPATIMGVPRNVDLTLVAGSDRYAVPGVGTMAGLEGRPSTTVWVDVRAGAAPYAVDLGYDGLTQTGAVATGRVAASAAEPLYHPLPVDRTGPCSVSGAFFASCLVDSAAGYPYVDGVGWARPGSTFALVVVLTTGQVSALTLDGVAEATSVSDGGSVVHAFPVAVGERRPTLRADVLRGTGTRVLTARLGAGLA